MKRLRRVDLGLVVILAICLLAIWPFLSRPGLPLETDAELHIVRTAELSDLLRRGAVYPRWAPDFYYGYGYPLFNYYAPLTYYVGAGLMLLPGVDPMLAVKMVFVLGFLGAGLGMYAYVRRGWGWRPGLVAAAAYLYAPYIQFIDPHARGVLAEAFSFAIFPWTLWAFTGLQGGSSRWRLPLAAGLLAALICTHNLMAMVFAVILAAWLVWQVITGPVPQARARYHAPLLAALALGLALSAFFWLPVALERDAVQLGNLISEGGHFDFRNHFLNLGELLSPTTMLDLGASDPHYRFNLGVAQWLLGLAGAASLLWKRGLSRQRRLAALFFVPAAGVLLLFVLPVSAFIWERVPLMPFLQFPWRLLGALSASLAVLAGAGMGALEAWVGARRADWAVAGIITPILLLALPLTFPAEWPAEPGPTTPEDIVHAELRGRWLGTTSTGDYVPNDVIVVPRPNDQVLESYRGEGPVDRVNRATLPAGTSVTLVNDRPLAWTYQIDGDAPFVFRLFHFYFPGWVATLDGSPSPIQPAEPDGFITVEIPAGSHQLEIAFRDTPVRKTAWAVSGLALLFCLLIGFRSTSGVPDIVRASPPAVPGYLVLVPLSLFAFNVAVAAPLGWFRLRSAGLDVARAQEKVYFEVGEHIALIGYDWRPAGPGDVSELTLYWKALRPVPVNYQVFVHLRDSSGQVAAQSDLLNPGSYPTTRWPLTRYVRDPHRLSIPAGIAHGDYRLAVGLWLMAEGERMPVYDAAGNHLGDSLLIESVTY